MLIRPKHHRVLLLLASFDLVLGILNLGLREGHFMVPFYFATASILFLTWLGTFTTLSNGVLKNRALFFRRRNLPVNEIESIRPQKKNGKWGYGLVLEVRPQTGKMLLLQPNHPQPLPAALHEQAPNARFLV